MKKEIEEALKDAGFNKSEISKLKDEERSSLMESRLREKRKSLLNEIYERDEQIRHIDWILYTLGKEN